ncbi:preprotein translocase subunit YajC [Actinoplanes sp. KI2]|uniref:preprotein translocase subunit YajC n=1 Tax=Actinoplanes sp. KI2 TaxID=2983315 RepID=UPI0021D5B894|nr:preprotein translocase subunit YajC [Actinoplanes sp. KI2]MCU7724794.1 preprotein translocase subunit YajC [Actinoplanes sp. KI2]
MPLAAPNGSGNSFTTILFLLLLFGVVYFLMIRPQQKRRREALNMQNQLGAGDQIVTIGGLHGTIVSMDDDVATLEVAPGVQVKFARQAIARTLPKQDAEETAAAEPEAESLAEAKAADEPPVVDDVQKDDVVADTQKKD